MGRGGGLFQYLSQINYDRMINCEQWKDKLRVIHVSLKGTMQIKNDNQHIIVR